MGEQGLAGYRLALRHNEVLGVSSIPQGDDFRFGLSDVLGVVPATSEADVDIFDNPWVDAHVHNDAAIPVVE